MPQNKFFNMPLSANFARELAWFFNINIIPTYGMGDSLLIYI